MLASQRVIDMSHDKIPVGRSCCNIICWPICYLHVALRKIANGRTKMLHGYNLLQGNDILTGVDITIASLWGPHTSQGLQTEDNGHCQRLTTRSHLKSGFAEISKLHATPTSTAVPPR